MSKKVIVLTIIENGRFSSNKELGDDELVEKTIKTNDSRYFGILYDRYCNKVFNKCMSFTKNPSEAQDLVQDIFLKVFLKLHDYEKIKASFSTWLYVIVYNHCTNYVTRDKKRWRNTFANTSSKDLKNHEEDEEVIELEQLNMLSEEKFTKALAEILPEEKALLLLRYQDDASIREIQELLSLNESAVKMRLNRAKKKLSKIYKNS